MAEVREEGLYWVKLNSTDLDWKVAHWYKCHKLWRFLDYIPKYVYPVEMSIVGSRILPPKEKEVRENGYYWVKGKYNTVWDVAEWISSDWIYKYATESFKDEHFSDIGPRLSPPEGE